MDATTPVRTGILLVSAGDPGEAEESVQNVLALLREAAPALLLHQQTLPSQRYLIEELLRRWCDEEELDLVLTIGGSFPAPGPSPAEIVPEATQAVLERAMPSLPEAMRAYALPEEPAAILDRGVAGIRGRTLLLNLPAGGHLPSLFLEGVADLLPAILARLRSSEGREPQPFAPAAPPAPPERTKQALDPEEFSAFLREHRQDRAD